MSGETNLTDKMETGEPENGPPISNDSLAVGTDLRRRQTGNFVEPLTPCIRSSSLADLSKKGGPGTPGRPSKKRTASGAGDIENDCETEEMRRIRELEFAKESLEKRLMKL